MTTNKSRPAAPAWADLSQEIQRQAAQVRRGRPRPRRLAFLIEEEGGRAGLVVPPLGIGNAPGQERAKVSVPASVRDQIADLAPSVAMGPALVCLAAWAADELQRRGARLVVSECGQ